jgi:DNA-directed RNA polymerase subunit beta
MKQQREFKQVSFAKHKFIEQYLPDFLEVQKNSYADFLQQNIPLEKKKMVGIHRVLTKIFGLAGTNDIYIKQLPDNSENKERVLKKLADFAHKGVRDIERMILYELPIKKYVENKQVKEIVSELEKMDTKVLVVPSGLFTKVGDTTVTIQYNGYTLVPSKYPLSDDKEARLYNNISNSSQYIQLPVNFNRQSCKFTGRTYDARLEVNFRVIREKEGEEPKIIDDNNVYLTNIPLMTENASFIINGVERVVITQIHKPHGVFFVEDEENEISREGRRLYVANICSSDTQPQKNIVFKFDSDNNLYVIFDIPGSVENKKIPVTKYLHSLGITYEEIKKYLFYTEKVSIEELKEELGKEENKEKVMLAEEIVDEQTGEVLYEIFTLLDQNVLEDISQKIKKRKYIEVARKEKNVAMFNTVSTTIEQKRPPTIKEDIFYVYKIICPNIPIKEKDIEDYDTLKKIEAEIYKRTIYNFSIGEIGRFLTNKKLNEVYKELKDFDEEAYKELNSEKSTEYLTELQIIDILATIKYLIYLNNNEKLPSGKNPKIDDIDHLGGRHIRPVGEQIEEQFLHTLETIARSAKEQIQQVVSHSKGISALLPKNLINNITLTTAISKFFKTNELSQLLDETNLLSAITSKRRLSALGMGGLTRRYAGFEVRDIHPTSYGRICPIETPEGQNIGLITSLALFARVNKYGLIETPYRKVENGKVTDEVVYMDASEEEDYVITSTDAVDVSTGKLKEGKVLARTKGEIIYVDSKNVDYVDISPQQQLSVSASLIPFIEHDDANRALMGANMQRQAVPLLVPEAPLVATGIEPKVAKDSYGCIIAKRKGKVLLVDASEIVILTDDGDLDFYYLPKFQRTNQDTTKNYIPIVVSGQEVKEGEPIAGDLCTDKGQLALGKNVLVAFMSFEGYNYEDAILISERLVKDDVFTSLTIMEFETDARETKLGPEIITRDLASEQITEEKMNNLDEEGIIRIGTEVKPGDILVGKIVPKSEQATTVEEKLLQAIFGKKLESGKVVPLEVPPGVRGKVIWRQVIVRTEKLPKSEEKEKLELLKEQYIKIKKFIEEEKEYVIEQKSKEYKKFVEKYYSQLWEEYEKIKEQTKEKIRKPSSEDLPLTVLQLVRVYIASFRKIQVGDKLSGRHGNKGVVAKIFPEEDMPYLPDGTPVDVVLSPLGVPSRMNVGQLLETMLGWSAKQLNVQYITPPFDGATEEDVKKEIRKAKEFLKKKGVPEKYLPDDTGKITLYDGRTGEPFMEKCFVGYMYIMKLIHMVEDKVHARSTGPYSLVTKQPLGGKAHFGGQRLGEMEVWALEGYGAAYTLQNFLTIKSDDVEGRKKIYESIVKGEPLTYTGVPESFKVLVKELQALALNIEFLTKKNKLKEYKEEIKVKKNKSSE